MLGIIIHLVSLLFPVLTVTIIYRQNKINFECFGTQKIKLNNSYYIILFLSSLYFCEYFLHFVMPNINSLNKYLTFANHYISSPKGYFTYDNFMRKTVKISLCSIPLTVILYVSINSLTKLQSFGITLIFLVLIEPLQYLVNVLTLTQYHYISILDIVFSCLGASLGMLVLLFVPQITSFKDAIFKPIKI